MKNTSLFIIVTVFLLGMAFLAFSQEGDTIVVYDFTYVTDTVWVEPEIATIPPSLQEQLLSLNWDENQLDLSEVHSDAGQYSSIVSKSKGIEWAQFKDHLNFFVKANAAMQIHWTDRTFGPDGEFPTATFGFGAASGYHLNQLFALEPKISFLQKGCQMGYLYDSIDGKGTTKTKIGYEGYQNRFNYLSADLVLKIGKNASSKFSPHVYGGLRGDLLLWSKVEYLVDQGFSADPIFETIHLQMSDYKDFHRLNYGWVAGFGAEMKNKWYLQFEVNADIAYLAKGYRFRAQNLIASLNAGVYLSAFKR